MCAKKIESFKDLYAWQEASKIARNIYKITESFPETEKFGLTTQMRRAAVSVPSNIAESFSRKGKKEEYECKCWYAEFIKKRGFH
jgi:four helix bundle protein